MKIISLNAHSAYSFQELMEFFEFHRGDTDVFCLQEITSCEAPVADLSGDGVRPDALQQIAARLPGFHSFRAPVQDQVDWIYGFDDRASFGLATFVRDGLHVTESADIFLCNAANSYVSGDYATLGYNALRVTVDAGGGPLDICSVHGVSMPGDKLDTLARLRQSDELLAFLDGRPGERVVMGDFNLLPETESIRKIERAGYRNLISEFSVRTTRGSLVKKLHPEYGIGPFGFQEYADYAFVTSGVKVNSFQVPDVPVSDHLPLILEITA